MRRKGKAMLYEVNGDKLIRKHRPLNDDIKSSARVRMICGYANHYGERIDRIKREIAFCFSMFETAYKQNPRGWSSKLNADCAKWDSAAKDAIEWLMRSIADDELDKAEKQNGRDEARKSYGATTNREQFTLTVDLLQKVPFDMMQTIEFLTLSLWLGWVDEENHDRASQMFGVIAELWGSKESFRYHEQFVAVLPRALDHLNNGRLYEINKIEDAYCAFVRENDQYTGGRNRPIIDALGGAWVRMTDPKVFADQLAALALLREGSIV